MKVVHVLSHLKWRHKSTDILSEIFLRRNDKRSAKVFHCVHILFQWSAELAAPPLSYIILTRLEGQPWFRHQLCGWNLYDSKHHRQDQQGPLDTHINTTKLTRVSSAKVFIIVACEVELGLWKLKKKIYWEMRTLNTISKNPLWFNPLSSTF